MCSFYFMTLLQIARRLVVIQVAICVEVDFLIKLVKFSGNIERQLMMESNLVVIGVLLLFLLIFTFR